MGNNDFVLNIIAALNKQLSKVQLKNDLKGLDNTLSVKVIAKLATVLSKKQLGDSLKQMNNLYVQVGTKFKTDKNAKNELLKEIEQLQKNITELQLKVGVEHGASKNVISSVISTAKTAQRYADKTAITLDIEVRKEKAVNDILYIGQRYSKLFSNVSASQKYENLLNSAYSISDKAQLQEVRAQISAFTSDLKAHGLAVQSTGDKWRKLTERAKDLFSAASIVRMVFSQTKQAVSTTIDLDKVYTDLVKVQSELTRNDYPEYLERCNKKAQELATSQKALIEGAEEFSKSGYDLSTSDKLIERSTILSNVGEMSASDSAKAIISGVQAYDVVDGYTDVVEKAEALTDKYNEIGNTASITTKEIAEGVQTVGSVFADANTNVDEFIALLAAGNRQFQDADSLALGLRTSALRIRGCTAELEAMGEETDTVVSSTAKLEEKIKALTNVNGSGGVEILEADKETFRSIYDIFADIGKVYKDMSDTDQSALLELIAGKHRASAISATLNNMTEAEEILERSINAAGSAQKEYDAYLESTEAHLQQFQSKLVETYTTLLTNGDMISHAADLGTAILNLVNKTDLLKHSLVAIATIKIGQGITAVGGAIAGTVSQMNTLGNALQMVKNLPLDDVLKNDVLSKLGESTKLLTEKNLKLLLSQQQLSTQDKINILSIHGLTEEEARAKLETMGLTTATNAQTAANTGATASANTLKGAFTGLAASVKATWAAMSMLQKASIIFAAVSTAWSIGSSIFSSMKQHNEELAQSTKEAANAYTETSRSIDEYVSRYQELRQALIAAKDNEEETYNIKQQLLELQKELNEKFGDEYDKINLVTDSYKDQTEAIREYNKEAAKRFLNENREGIEDAEKAMTKKRRYNLSYGAMSFYTDEGAAVKEIAGKYEDKGLWLNEDSGNGTYNLILDADVQSAYQTINDFENNLRDKAKELGNEHIFDDVLDASSRALNDAKDVIDGYGESFNKALIAEIAADDDKAETYNKALEAVKSYNEAVLNSENPYDDEKVAQAKNDMDAIKDSIQANEEEWGKYSSLMDDVFDQADTRLYDFNEAFKTDSEMKKLADELKGFTDLDLQAFDDKEGENQSFDKLKESAKEYEVSAEELISTLVELGYVQSKVVNQNIDSTEIKSFTDAWEQLKSSTDDATKDLSNTLTELAEQGRLTIDAFNEADSTDYFENLGISAEEAVQKINALVSSSTQLQSMSAQISKMSDMLADKKNGNAAKASDLAGFDAEVRGLDSWKEFESVMGSSKSTMEQCQEAANNLATEWINSGNYLSNLTEKNKDYYITALQNMGIENAEEIVKNALTLATQAQSAAEEFLAQKKRETSNETYSLIDATAEEITKFAEEKGYADNVTNALIELALKKQLVNGTTLDFSGDLANISNYVKALGGTANAIGLLNRIKKGEVYMPGDAMASVIASAQAEIDGAIAVGNKTNVQVNPVGSSGYKSSNPSDKGKNSGTKDTKQTVDWIERKLSVLNDKIALTQSKFENLFNIKSPKNLSNKIKQTTKELQKAEKASSKWKNALGKIKISDSLKKDIQGGKKIDLSKYSKAEQKEIKKYQSAYKNYANAKIKENTLNDKLWGLQTSTGKDNNLKSQIKQYEALADAYDKAAEKYKKYADKVKLSSSLKKKVQTGDYNIADYSSETQKLIQEYEDLWKKYQDALKGKQESKQSANDKREERYQLYVDDAESKIAKSQAYAELDAGNYKKQNAHLKAQKGYIKESYKYQIKIAKLNKDSVEAAKLKAELQKELNDLTMQEFDNIANTYDKQIGLNDNKIRAFQDQISLLEAKGQKAGSALYSKQISLNNVNEKKLVAEREKLISKLSEIPKGTDDWYDAQDKLFSVESELVNIQTENANLQKSINQLKFDRFDDLIGKLNDVVDETNFLKDMLDSDHLFDDNGMITDDGLTAIGLTAQNYDTYLAEAEKYKQMQEDLEKMYANGDIGITDYESKMREYKQGQMDAIKSANDAKKAVIDYVKQGLDAQNGALSEAIDKQKELLRSEKDLYDFQQKIASQNKNIADLQKQINALEGDDSEENRKRLQQLKAELAEAEQEQKDTLYDRSISDQEDALDQMLKNSQEQAENYLKDSEKVFMDAFEYVNAHTSQIANNIEAIAKETGYDISTNITNAWKNSGDAVDSYENILKGSVPNVTAQIDLITSAWQDAAIAAENAAKSMVTATTGTYIAHTGDGSNNNGSNSSSVTNAHEGTFGVGVASSIASSVNAVKLSSVESFINKNKQKATQKKSYYAPLNEYIYDKTGGYILSKTNEAKLGKLLGIDVKTDLTGEKGLPEINKILSALKSAGFSKGGLVDASDVLRKTGEDGIALVKHGEYILSKDQTDSLMKLVNMTPTNMLSYLNRNTPVPVPNRTPMNINIDSSVHVDGVATDKIVQDMAGVAKKQAENVISEINRRTYAKGVRWR